MITCPHDKRSALRRGVHEAADRLANSIEFDWTQGEVERAYEDLAHGDNEPYSHLDFTRSDDWVLSFVIKHPEVKIAFTEAACVEHRERGEHS